MDPSRRFFLKGLVIATTAPGIVKASNLMKLSIPKFSIAMPNPLNLFMRGDPDGERMASKDFWTWSDLDDPVMSEKLKSLGINESFMDGESTWSSSDGFYGGTRSVGWDQVHREFLLDLPPETEDEMIFWSRITGVSPDLLGLSFNTTARTRTAEVFVKDSEAELKRGLRDMFPPATHIHGPGWISTRSAFDLFSRTFK